MVVQTKNSSSSEDVETGENSAGFNSKTESAQKVLNGLKKRQKSSMTSGFDSLEILRTNVQYYFDSQIKDFMKDFVEKFFQPAIKNINENTDETISEHQMQSICKNLLENCAKLQYSNDVILPKSASFQIKNTLDEASDSDTSEAKSLLHQALKRKRTEKTESETENYKRQFFITTATPTHFYNTTVASIAQQNNAKQQSMFNKPTSTSSLLTSALTSAPKPMVRQTPIFHLIPANRNMKLSSTHIELANLLKQNNSAILNKANEGKNKNISESTN